MCWLSNDFQAAVFLTHRATIVHEHKFLSAIGRFGQKRKFIGLESLTVILILSSILIQLFVLMIIAWLIMASMAIKQIHSNKSWSDPSLCDAFAIYSMCT